MLSLLGSISIEAMFLQGPSLTFKHRVFHFAHTSYAIIVCQSPSFGTVRCSISSRRLEQTHVQKQSDTCGSRRSVKVSLNYGTFWDTKSKYQRLGTQALEYNTENGEIV